MIFSLFTIIRYFTLLICGFYCYAKLTKHKLRANNLLDILVAGVLATTLYFGTKHVHPLSPICLLLSICIYMLIRYRGTISEAFTIGTIACGVSIFSLAIIFLPSMPIGFLVFFFIADETIQYAIMIPIMSAMQFLFVWLLFKIKRFKSGINIKINGGNTEYLLFASIVCVFLMMLFYNQNASYIGIALYAIAFFGLALIVFWRKHITNNYLKQLRRRDDALIAERIDAYEKERDELKKQNVELAKIIHRDNKLIPAMTAAVKRLAEDMPSDDELQGLIDQLNELATERNSAINDYMAKADDLPKTNNTSFDAVIRFLHGKALQNHVEFDISIDEKAATELFAKVPTLTDLNTVLCDLGENAIIATKNLQSGQILLSLETADSGAPRICFSDNGAHFDEKVIARMGQTQITTHKADGGSGIGLMALFEIIDKYKASFLLNECPQSIYTKSIEICFDGLNKRRVITKRDVAKKACAVRADFERAYI